jgi:hypothetical protein
LRRHELDGALIWSERTIRGGIKLDPNYTQVSAVYDATHNAVMLVENGFTAAVLAQPITTANLTSGALVSLTVSGDVTAP